MASGRAVNERVEEMLSQFLFRPIYSPRTRLNLLSNLQGGTGGKMNRFALTSTLARAKLLPANPDLVGELDDFLTQSLVCFFFLARALVVA
jgi:hypothetical protein